MKTGTPKKDDRACQTLRTCVSTLKYNNQESLHNIVVRLTQR